MIPYEIMSLKKKTPTLNLEKIQGIEKISIANRKVYNAAEIGPVLHLIQTTDNVVLQQQLKNYFIIRTVSFIESRIKGYLIPLINDNSLDVSSLFNGELTISLDDLDKIDRSLTKGDIVVTNFNFQSLDNIFSIYSKLLQIDFFSTMMDVIDSKKSGIESHTNSGSNMIKNWPELEKMFLLRHKIIHNLEIVEEDVDFKYLKILQNTVATFLTLTWNLSYHILKFKRKDYDKNVKFKQFIACKIQEYKKSSKNS